jgi:hypothetical protein
VTKDFAPITLAGFSANLLVANPSFPPNSVKELIEYARRTRARVNYGSSGNGTSVHLAMELFKSMTKTYMLHIPYKGSAPVVTDLIAGQVDVMFDNMPNVIGHVRAGKMKAAGGHLRAALAAGAGNPDRGRGRRARLRADRLVRRARARGHAARDHRQAERRDHQGAELGLK